jgi:hypothetical protein
MQHSAALIPLVLLLSACGGIPTVTSLQGTVFEDRDSADGLADASIAVHDESGKKFGKAKTNDSGAFRIDAPAGGNVFLVIDGEGSAPVSFSGIAGLTERLRIDDGLLFGYSNREFSDVNEAFDGCAGVGEGGAVIGEVRVINFTDPDTRENPLVVTGTATLIGNDGTEWPACYLDDGAEKYDPSAEVTGLSGQFAIFGVPRGVYVMRVAFTFLTVEEVIEEYFVYMPGEGAVSPRFPAWVEVPLAGGLGR